MKTKEQVEDEGARQTIYMHVVVFMHLMFATICVSFAVDYSWYTVWQLNICYARHMLFI